MVHGGRRRRRRGQPASAASPTSCDATSARSIWCDAAAIGSAEALRRHHRRRLASRASPPDVVGVHQVVNAVLPPCSRRARRRRVVVGDHRSGAGAGLGGDQTRQDHARRIVAMLAHPAPQHPVLVVAMRSTVPTEFGLTFDLPLLGDLMGDWALHGLAQAEFIDTDEVRDFLVHMYATTLPYTQVNISVSCSDRRRPDGRHRRSDRGTRQSTIPSEREPRGELGSPDGPVLRPARRRGVGVRRRAARRDDARAARRRRHPLRHDRRRHRLPPLAGHRRRRQPLLGRAQQGQALDRRRPARPEGQELVTALITAPGANAGSSCRTSPSRAGSPTSACARRATISSTSTSSATPTSRPRSTTR